MWTDLFLTVFLNVVILTYVCSTRLINFLNKMNFFCEKISCSQNLMPIGFLNIMALKQNELSDGTQLTSQIPEVESLGCQGGEVCNRCKSV